MERGATGPQAPRIAHEDDRGRDASAEALRRQVAADNPLASIVLFAAVVLAPFPFGSTDPIFIAVGCIAFGLALLTASTRGLKANHLAALAGIGVVVAAYAFVLHQQVSQHPWTEAAAHPIWRAASDLLKTQVVPIVSIEHTQPYFALGAPIAAMLCLGCSVVVCANRERARQLLQVVAWSGCAYAILGVLLFELAPDRLLWREKTAYLESVTGTFVNRNTAAVYFGVSGIVCLLLLLQRIRSTFRRSLRRDLIATFSKDINARDLCAGRFRPVHDLLQRHADDRLEGGRSLLFDRNGWRLRWVVLAASGARQQPRLRARGGGRCGPDRFADGWWIGRRTVQRGRPWRSRSARSLPFGTADDCGPPVAGNWAWNIRVELSSLSKPGGTDLGHLGPRP